MDEESARDVFAELSMLRFVCEVLLANFIGSLPAEYREPFIADLLRSGMRTDHLTGTARSEAHAEMLADVAVRYRERLATIVAAARARAAE